MRQLREAYNFHSLTGEKKGKKAEIGNRRGLQGTMRPLVESRTYEYLLFTCCRKVTK